MSAALFRERRFWALFWTQFLGAFNDNLFKNALVILIAYGEISLWSLDSDRLVALSTGIFILPYFLFSATAGQISDKLSKSKLMTWIKFAEIPIMVAAALGFWLQRFDLLILCLFFMGLQSTFFGPAKYSVIPELLKEDELVGGNGLVEMGTFVAILIGTLAGGILIAIPGTGPHIVAFGIIVVAVLGYFVSRLIPRTAPAAPNLKISLDPITPTLQTWRAARGQKAVYNSILGISWFWFVGAVLLTILPKYSKDLLFGAESVVTLFLALFSLGIALGSVLCERMSHKQLELGLVPFGSIGISLFAADLWWVGNPRAGLPDPAVLYTLSEFLGQPGSIRIALDLALLAVFSGFYTVPLYTLIQERSPVELRSRVVAANNILNAFFMVVASVLLALALGEGWSIPTVLGVLALLNAAVALYIYTLIPEFLLRFVAWMVATVMYRVKVEGRDNLPRQGAAVLVANHVTFVDWLILGSVVKRPARFVMYHTYFKMPVVGFLFRGAKVIPIAPAHESKDTLEAAFDKIAAELAEGELVCIFPEGKLTKTGELEPFRTGIERIIARSPVPVVPMALQGMWGSFFSKSKERGFFRRVRSKVKLTIGPAISPAAVTAQGCAEAVAALGGFKVPPLPVEPPALP